MPHILIQEQELNRDLNFKNSDVFTFKAKGEIDLIGVSLEGEEFLLAQREKNGNTLIKYDKITRSSNLNLLKEALEKFAKFSNANVIRSNIAQKSSEKIVKELRDIKFFEREFQTDKEIWIEIGFGTGRHILHQAKKNPDILFIGIEIYKPSIETLSKHIKLNEIDNILIVDYDARLFLEFIQSNSVGKIFVHFPVPWDKKPHRRIYSIDFLNEAIRVLKKDGNLELRTDSQKYFDYCLELFFKFNKIDFQIKKNIDLEISSKYEDRWKRQNKNIYDLTLTNFEISENIELKEDFEFDFEIDFEKLHNSFENSSLKFEDFIIHLEKIYKIDDKSGLIRVTLGSFNRPECKYIYIEDNKIRYFRSKPVLSKANISAHQNLKEWFRKHG